MFIQEDSNPDLNFAIIGPTDNPLTVEPNAPDQLLVTLQGPQAGTTLNVPQPDGVV